jgi:hypothetical protein
VRIRRIIALALAAVLAAAGAVPLTAGAAKIPGPGPSLSIESAGATTVADGRLDVTATVVVPRASNGMSVRLRLYAPDGNVAYQTSRAIGRADEGVRQVAFAQDLTGRTLKEGRYRVEIRATVTGFAAVTAEAPVYVVDGARPPMPLSVIVRFPAAPLGEPSGAFATDPAAEPSSRSEAEAFASLATARPDLHLSLILPPLALDEWRRIGTGYALASPTAPRVPADAPTPTAYRRTLEALRRAAPDALLLGVGYADPSLDGLERMSALADLGRQLEMGALVTSETLGVQRTFGLAVSGGSLPSSATGVLAARSTGFVLLDPDGARVSRGGVDATAAPGAHPIAETTQTALVVDTRMSEILAGPVAARSRVVDELFARLTAKARDGQPVVAVVDVGPGSTATVVELEATLATLARVGWLRFVSARDAASTPRGESVLLPRQVPAKAALPVPESFWRIVGDARSRAMALLAATAPTDPEATAAILDVMIAESSSWTGPSTGRDFARGTAFAKAADLTAMATLSKVTLAVPNITFAGSTGRVPVSVSNGSDRTLQLVLRAIPEHVRMPKGRSVAFLAPPGETILSVQVDMGATIAGGVQFDLMAGDMVLSTGRSAVRASYIDRVFLIGTVVLVLLGLLWYIRSRGRGAVDRIRSAAGRRAGEDPK